jgi:hypothetical protein
VRVRGFVSAAMGVGIREYAKMAIAPMRRRGRTRRGRRIRRARRVERQIVPKRVVVAWLNAARTTSRDVGAGLALRWKYHCDTVAAVVERWIPLITERVQMYISTK